MILSLLGVDEFLPSDSFFDLMGEEECKENMTSIIVCESILFLICGPDISELDPVILHWSEYDRLGKKIGHHDVEHIPELDFVDRIPFTGWN